MKAGDSVHHQSARKRTSLRCEPYPHPNPFVRLLDRVMVLFGFLIALATAPQAWIIWRNQSAEDVSLIAWSFYLFNAVVYLLYAIVHKEYPLLLGASLLIVINAVIVLGILVYS